MLAGFVMTLLSNQGDCINDRSKEPTVSENPSDKVKIEDSQ